MIVDLNVSSVLDVGCGPGELLLALAQVRPQLRFTGVDLAPQVIAANARNLPGMKFQVLDLQDGPLDQRFDLVISSEVIEHLSDWRQGIRHLASMVAEGGYLAITVPTGRIYDTERHFGHVEHPTSDELVMVAMDQRLELLELRNWGFPFYRFLKIVTNVEPDFALRAFGEGGYGPGKKFVSHFLYWLTFLGPKSSPAGCQLFALFRRAAN